jgi:hypothetical protein
MLSQFLVGLCASAVNIAIHANVMAAVIRVLNRLQAVFSSRP